MCYIAVLHSVPGILTVGARGGGGGAWHCSPALCGDSCMNMYRRGRPCGTLHCMGARAALAIFLVCPVLQCLMISIIQIFTVWDCLKAKAAGTASGVDATEQKQYPNLTYQKKKGNMQ